MVASVSTKATAADMPSEVSIFFDTPRKGQMPRNCANTMLLTKMALMKMSKYSIDYAFFSLLTMAMRKPSVMKAPGGSMNSRML